MGNEKITNKEEFLNYLENLLAELKSNGGEWNNRTLESYLSAMIAWVDDMEGYYENMGVAHDVKLERVNWRVFADILSAARIYE